MKTISTLLIAVFVFSFLFFALPEKGYSGVPVFELPGCCQFFDASEGNECGIIDNSIELSSCNEFGGTPLSGETCNEETGFCSGFAAPRSIPTLSEWGLIATAGILGFIGFMYIRRRKAAA